jgi:predicted nuclease of restriction endonuclease-like RecB superfamily
MCQQLIDALKYSNDKRGELVDSLLDDVVYRDKIIRGLLRIINRLIAIRGTK